MFDILSTLGPAYNDNGLVVELSPAAGQVESVPLEYVEEDNWEDLMGEDTDTERADRRSLNSLRPGNTIGFHKRYLGRVGKRMVDRRRWL